MNPLEEFLESYVPQEKKAFSFAPLEHAAKEVGKGALSGAGAAAAAATMGVMGLAASKIYGAATKARDFRQMLEVNPDLREHHERDPKMFNQMFSSLRNMNPHFSSDPIVAGTYMRRMAENPMTAGGILTESVSARDKFPSILDRATEEGIGASVKRFSPRPMGSPPSGGGGRPGPTGPLGP